MYIFKSQAACAQPKEVSCWMNGRWLCGSAPSEAKDSAGRTYTVPTVPLLQQNLSPYFVPSDLSGLAPDESVRTKIKWYIKPLAFGGEPASQENITWLTHDQHIEAVKWWNERFRSTGLTLTWRCIASARSSRLVFGLALSFRRRPSFLVFLDAQRPSGAQRTCKYILGDL